MRRNTLKVFFSIFLILLSLGSESRAQYLVNAVQTSFAGGGISSLFGPQSMYLNPGNLMLNVYGSGNSIELGSLAFSSPYQEIPTQLQSAKQTIINRFLFDESGLSPTEKVIFSNEKPLNSFLEQGSATLFAAQIRTNDWSIGLGARHRFIQQSTFSRDWYVPSVESIANSSRKWDQQSLRWNEYSVSLARSVDYLEGLSSSLNKIYFGITASYLKPISSHQMQISETINKTEDGTYVGIRDISIESAGSMNTVFNQIKSGLSSPNWDELRLNQQSIFSSNGWGLGLGLGFTYEIPFESNYGKAQNNTRLDKVIRISGSMTDVGFIEHSKNTSAYSSLSDSIRYSGLSYSTIESTYSGSIADTYTMFSNTSLANTIQHAQVKKTDLKLTQILPIQIHVGISVQYNWLLIGSDIHYGLNNELGNTQQIRLNAYTELSILPFLPIRFGASSKSTKIESVSAGIGLNLWFLAWDIGVIYTYSDEIDLMKNTAIAGTGLRIRF